MPQNLKTNLPPETKILSQTKREVTDPPETSPNPGLADPSQTVDQPAPTEPSEQETETVDQPFTIDGGGEPAPGEPTGDEPTGDPLKDTQRAYHKTNEELAKIKKVLAFMAANAQAGGGQAPYQEPPISPEGSLEPTEDERIDPTLYTKRMMNLAEAKREREQKILETQNFVEAHPDWQDLYPIMEEISNEETPGAFQRPGGLRRLHKRAKEREELRGYRDTMKGSADIALQAGINMQKKRGSSPFVSPSGGGGGRSKSAVPPDFDRWDTDKQLQWLKDHGLYKENIF